jgi:hypothetical protein
MIRLGQVQEMKREQVRKAPTREMYSSTVDLTSYLQEWNVSIPVFGYPLLNFSQKGHNYNETANVKKSVHFESDSLNEIEQDPSPRYRQMWKILARPITNKYAGRIPIAQMIDKNSMNEENFKAVMKNFTEGRPINF